MLWNVLILWYVWFMRCRDKMFKTQQHQPVPSSSNTNKHGERLHKFAESAMKISQWMQRNKEKEHQTTENYKAPTAPGLGKSTPRKEFPGLGPSLPRWSGSNPSAKCQTAGLQAWMPDRWNLGLDFAWFQELRWVQPISRGQVGNNYENEVGAFWKSSGNNPFGMLLTKAQWHSAQLLR